MIDDTLKSAKTPKRTTEHAFSLGLESDEEELEEKEIPEWAGHIMKDLEIIAAEMSPQY